MSPNSITVVIADDDEDLRGAIGGIISDEPGMRLVGEAKNASGVITLAGAKKPHVALIDVNMPGGGAKAAEGIKRASPATKVLVLSGFGDKDTVMRLLAAGADGYLVKTSSIIAIVEAIRGVHAGQGSLSGEVTRGVIKELADRLGAKRKVDEGLRRKAARIQRVLDNGILGMVYQPVVALETREVRGVEALARFYGKPKRTPDKWFAEATEVGKGPALELKAIGMAFECIDDIGGIYLGVNVSPDVLRSAAFRRCLETVADPSRVVVEVTEHAPVADYVKLRKALDALRKDGVRLAIDDAGAGFASLQHILRLAPEVIKLDRSLVNGVADDPSLQALAQGLITFSQGIGALIIAEGIETEAEATALAALGVTLGQGYYFARPKPLPL